MTKRISVEGKEARERMRLVSKETERVLEQLLIKGKANMFQLSASVALNLGLPLDDILEIVKAYVASRIDLKSIKTKNFGSGLVRKDHAL